MVSGGPRLAATGRGREHRAFAGGRPGRGAQSRGSARGPTRFRRAASAPARSRAVPGEGAFAVGSRPRQPGGPGDARPPGWFPALSSRGNRCPMPRDMDLSRRPGAPSGRHVVESSAAPQPRLVSRPSSHRATGARTADQTIAPPHGGHLSTEVRHRGGFENNEVRDSGFELTGVRDSGFDHPATRTPVDHRRDARRDPRSSHVAERSLRSSHWQPAIAAARAIPLDNVPEATARTRARPGLCEGPPGPGTWQRTSSSSMSTSARPALP
jgi:hypothetical protein